MRKKVEELTKEEWDILNETGMLWELYPEAPSTWYDLKHLGPHKCAAEDCHRIIEEKYKFCSYECACYAGAFSVTKGWLK